MRSWIAANDVLVYYFRWIIHNYSAPYAVSILKNLVPALKPGSRIIINDHCLRDAGSEKPWDDKLMRSMDMVMLTLLNAQEREEHEFRELFKAADERFSFKVSAKCCLKTTVLTRCAKGVTRVDGCRMSVVEAVWEPPAEVLESGKPTGENGETSPLVAAGDA